MKIGIIGGTKGLGKTLAYYLKNFKFNITISSRNPIEGQKIADEIGVKYINNNKELAKTNDIVIVSVPIASTIDVIRDISGSMKPGSLMIDVTSVKLGPSKVMSEVLNSDVEFIPTHPVFGPRTTDLDGQVIVLTPTKKGKWYPKLYNFLKKQNMRIIETTAQKHDDMMGIVQVLTHFSYISTASAIEKLKINIKETEEFESPIYNLMIDTIARIVSQNPFLTYSIQHENESGDKIRQAFADAVLELKDVISKSDEEEFRKIAIRATKNMGDIQGALGRSDKAINSLSHELTILRDSLGGEIGLKHIYSGKVHVGIINELNSEFVILNIKNSLKKIKISNVEILSSEELFNWKLKNQKIYTQSISSVFPRSASKEIIKDTLTRVENITEVNITDTYNGSQIDDDKISFTFEISSLTKKDIEYCEDLLKGFGGIIR